MKTIRAGVLEIAYLEEGPADGPPVILLHGFPYDVRSYVDVAPLLAQDGFRCIVPWLRGYGPTRFLSVATPRSGEQAALGADLVALMGALDIRSALIGGYDWGGRAACIVAALWPGRVQGLVSCGAGYNIQDIANAGMPASPEEEHRYWYQYYFHTERGRAGLIQDRAALCRFIWKLWSPSWTFDDDTFMQSAASFDNPDFVDIVIHSYRHRYGVVPGDPSVAAIETTLAAQPAIGVPAIVLQGADDGVDPPSEPDHDAPHFTGYYRRRIVAGTGHNLPQEAPDVFVAAIKELAALGGN